MGFKTVIFSFLMTVEQFNDLLRLQGSITVKAWEPLSSDKVFDLIFNSIENHNKLGLPGKEDGANHFFKTSLDYEGHLCDGRVTCNSSDGGKTYQGGISIEVYPEDQWSETR